MDLFREAALERGLIVVSSMNTMSDGDVETNIVALRYLWHDTHARFSIDDDRVYMAGFSGLARFLWNMPQLNVPLAGAIGVGAGLPGPSIPEGADQLPFYGVVGDRDFNWSELVKLREKLEEAGLPWRLEIFRGPHGWFTDPATASRALDWLMLHSFRRGAGEVDPALLLSRDRARVKTLIEQGDDLEAAELERAIRRDYGGLDLEIAGDLIVSERRYRALLKEREELIRSDESWTGQSERAVATAIAQGAGRLERNRALAMMRASGLVDDLSRDDDRGASAGRRIGQLRAQLDFYIPRMLLDRGEPERALLALELSAAIGDPGPRNRFQRARVLTILGRYDQAVDLIETLVNDDSYPVEYLMGDVFEPLRSNERYRALVDGD